MISSHSGRLQCAQIGSENLQRESWRSPDLEEENDPEEHPHTLEKIAWKDDEEKKFQLLNFRLQERKIGKAAPRPTKTFLRLFRDFRWASNDSPWSSGNGTIMQQAPALGERLVERGLLRATRWERLDERGSLRLAAREAATAAGGRREWGSFGSALWSHSFWRMFRNPKKRSF